MTRPSRVVLASSFLFGVAVVSVTAYLIGGLGAGIFGFVISVVGGLLGTWFSLRFAPPAERGSGEGAEAQSIRHGNRQIQRWMVIAAIFFALSGVTQLFFHQGALIAAVSFVMAGLCLLNLGFFRWTSSR